MPPLPPDDASELARLRLWVDAAQEFGRLSLWERDMRDGSGRWDRHIFSLYGLPPSDVAPTYEEMLLHLHPDDRDRLRASFRASLAAPGRHETRFRILHAQGHLVHVHSIWQVPVDGHQVVGVLIDDTDSLAQAKAHEAARTQMGLIAEMVGVSFWRLDLPSQRVHRVEDRWQGVVGDPGERGTPLAELREQVHPDDRPALERATQEAIEGRRAPTAEARYRGPDGRYRTVLTRRVLQRDADGRPAALLGVGVDITDQVRAREHLSELLERQDMLVEAAGIGVWRWDPVTGERHWNDALRRMYGVAADDPLPALEGSGVVSGVLPEDREFVRDAMRRAQDPEAPRVEATYRYRLPSGEVRMMVGRARCLARGSRAITGVVLDVTDLRRAEAALRDRAMAESTDRERSAFLSRVSHELRTPLNAVLGFTGLLLDPAAEPLSAAQRSQLQHVQDAGRHLLELVDDLLTIGRWDQRADADASQSCDLSSVIEQVIAWQGDRANAAGVQICASGHCPPVLGDEKAWRQVVGNLLSNAIKYNVRGGRVQIALRLTNDPRWAELEVRDSGIGMSAEQRQHLFEPFNRLGAERLGVQGTGLGLSIVRRIARSLGGEVDVDSRPGVGTTVRVRVPRDVREAAPGDTTEVGRAPARASATASPPTAGPAEGSTPPLEGGAETGTMDVVYVEDNAVNAMVVQQVLALRPGVRLHLAADVASALSLTRQVRPVLLLVDMHLPDGNGFDLIARLPAEGATPTRACVALSADVMPAEVERALAAGFDEYWSKPIDVVRFLAGIDRLLAASA